MNETILTINYEIPFQSNRGKISLVLPAFLPCSVSDFNKVLDIISNSGAEADGHAATLDNFIKEAVQELKTKRDNNPGESDRARKIRKYCTAQIKKYVSLSEKLAARFGTEAADPEDDDMKIKMTPATVHTGNNKHAQKINYEWIPGIYTFNGWKFTKGGYNFLVYRASDIPAEEIGNPNFTKENCGRGYCVILAGTGAAIGNENASSKAGAPYLVTDKIIKLLDDGPEKIEAARERFKKAMTAAGYVWEEVETRAEKKEEKKTTENQEKKEEQKTENQEQEQKKEVKTMGLNTRYFSSARNLEDVKKLFKQYARELHPDNGGDPEEFKNMMTDYRAAFNRAKSGMTPEQAAAVETPEEFADVINAVINLDGVNIEICGAWVWISGNTYPVKDTLKAAGYRFASRKKMWYYHADGWRKHGKTCDMDKIRELHGSISITGHGPGYRIGAAV